MSALAKLCFNNGVFVSGSDATSSHITDELEHLGIEIHIGHKKSNIVGAELVVYTCAVSMRNVELKEAKKQGIQILERADFLGLVSNEYKNVIAIAGSHGKTTVASMIGKIFVDCGIDPTILIGGEMASGSNLRIGKKDFLIVEACEYKEHFLKLKHNTAVILNIDYDHPDYFKNASAYANAFNKFSRLSLDKTIISEKYKMFLETNLYVTYGKGGTYSARHIKHHENMLEFDVYKNGKFFNHIVLNLIGTYNIMNALCSVAVADCYKLEKEKVKRSLAEYEGVKRRYEYMGKLLDNIVITDYAHHPTQIANCIEATREVYKKPITVVFEPHTYSRTKSLFFDFLNSLEKADNLILLPTYSAREKTIVGGRSKDLFDALKFKKKNVKYIKTYSVCLEHLKKLKNNIILLLGAGSIINLAETIKQNYLNAQN